VELSQCGAGGLLKARATMRVSDTSGHGGDGGSGARCWLWLLLLALSSLSSYCLYPGGGSSTPARVRRGSVGIYPRYYGSIIWLRYDYRPAVRRPVRLRFVTDCVSSAAPPREVYRVFPPEIDISDSVSVSRAQGEGPTPRVPRFAGRSHPTAPRRAAACARVGRVSEATQVVIVDHPRFRAASAPRPSVRVPRKIQLHV